MTILETSQAVPQTTSELSAIVEGVRRGDDRRIGRRALGALVSMLEHPHRAAVQNISQIAKETNVDPSTLTRLGQRLGFSGFTELQEVFRRHVAERGLFYSTQTQGLIERNHSGAPNGLQDLANEEVGRLLETVAGLDEDEVRRAAELICKAEVVYVMGLRATHAVAYFFTSFASFLRPRVFMLGTSGNAIAEEMAQITEKDVFVPVSFRPYTQITVDACTAMMKRDIPIVALTDLSSPIAGEGPSHVTLRARSPFYFSSAASNFFVAQILLSAVAQQLGEAAIGHMGNVEVLLRELSIETE